MNLQINDQVFDHFPILESKRLLFRNFDLEDSEMLFSIRSNPTVLKYMDAFPQKDAVAATLLIQNNWKAFSNKEGLNWAIVEKESQQFIGYFGFWRLIKNHCRAEIGYALHPSYWNKGYMHETVQSMLDFAFNQLRLHSIEANVNPNNKASIALLKKNGFVQEAYFKEDYLFDGQFLDSMIFSRLEPL